MGCFSKMGNDMESMFFFLIYFAFAKDAFIWKMGVLTVLGVDVELKLAASMFFF